MHKCSLAVGLAAALVLSRSARAQIVDGRTAAITYGHHHVNASNIDAHRTFWIDGLGGRPITINQAPNVIVEFRNVLVFLREQTPAPAGTETTVHHVAFKVPDLKSASARLTALHYPVTVESIDGEKDATFVIGPDRIRVQLVEDRVAGSAVALDHIHLASAEPERMQQWYSRILHAAPGGTRLQPAAALPGVRLLWSRTPAPPAPTKGRTLDHIGFEVQQLEAFCTELQQQGLTLDRPYSKVPALGIAVAYLTDPWGTNIELTEGLNRVP